jgi:RNA polymerase sigma-70 factor (ECF subfamily)
MKDAVTDGPNGPCSEPEAIRRAQRGDPAAFEYLYRVQSKAVYSLCFRMLKNRPDAEDLTQQVFLRLFRKIGTFRGDSCLSTWLYRVTVNAVLMHLRRSKRTEPLDDTPEDGGKDGAGAREIAVNDTTLLGSVDRIRLRRAVHSLPAGYRRLFVLHDILGYKHTEIASILRCSSGGSKSQLHRARKRLRQLLRGEIPVQTVHG